jgi:NAD-dependent SIR2 family protein deacetylase
MNHMEDFDAAHDAFIRARRVVVVTGAGISAASGIPTYRSAGSGWDNERHEQMSQANRYGSYLPELWRFWGGLRALTAAACPNPAHHALADWEARLAASGGSMLVATQNIDALHVRAGSTTVELHGSLHRSRCMRCRAVTNDSQVPVAGTVPSCAACGGRLRPDVVLFGEQLSSRRVKQVLTALSHCDVCLYVGTSGQVWPVRDMVTTARHAGATCVLVNAEPWQPVHPDFHHTLLGPAEAVLPALVQAS